MAVVLLPNGLAAPLGTFLLNRTNPVRFVSPVYVLLLLKNAVRPPLLVRPLLPLITPLNVIAEGVWMMISPASLWMFASITLPAEPLIVVLSTWKPDLALTITPLVRLI